MPSHNGVRFSYAIQRDRNPPWVGVGQTNHFVLIFPIAVGENFLEEPEARTMGDQLRRVRLDHRLAAAEGDLDRTQPLAKIGQNPFPCFRRGGIFAIRILPDVAVHALGVTQLRQENDNRGWPAMICQAAACDRPKPIVYAVIDPFITPAET